MTSVHSLLCANSILLHCLFSSPSTQPLHEVEIHAILARHPLVPPRLPRTKPPQHEDKQIESLQAGKRDTAPESKALQPWCQQIITEVVLCLAYQFSAHLAEVDVFVVVFRVCVRASPRAANALVECNAQNIASTYRRSKAVVLVSQEW